MKQVVVAMILGLTSATVAYAQVAPGETGGRSGGPNQSQSVVPSGATGGRAGGPNQSGFVKKASAPAKKSKPKH